MVTCKKCGKEFRTEAALKDHSRDARVHRENTYEHKSPYRKWGLAILVLSVIVIGIGVFAYKGDQTGSTTSPSNILPDLTTNDFNLSGSGCQFVNQTSGQTEFRFSFTLTNRFNENVHFLTAYVAGILGVVGKNQSFTSSLDSPTYTNALTLMVTIPTGAIPRNSLAVLSVSFGAHAKEVSGDILKIMLVNVALTYPACSS